MAIDIDQPGLAGDGNSDDGFARLFEAHWPQIHATLTRLVGDPDEAEDLALETFWRLYRRPPRDRGAGPGGWLHRVAMNLGFNALRSRRRRQGYEQTGGAAWLETTAAPSPEEAADRRETQARVRLTLLELPEREAQLLILRHSGFSYPEIAGALKVAPGSVGTLLARAEAAFETRWRAVGEDQGERR